MIRRPCVLPFFLLLCTCVRQAKTPVIESTPGHPKSLLQAVEHQDLRAKYENLLKAMQSELKRNMTIKIPGYPPPYFISYLVKDTESLVMSASNGAIFWENRNPVRTIYTEVRVGDYNFDSSVSKGSAFSFPQKEFYSNYAPLEDMLYAMRRRLWLLTDQEYKEALASYLNNKAKAVYTVKEEEIPSFSREEPAIFTGEPARLNIAPEALREKIRELSRYFNGYEDIIDSEVRGDFRKNTVIFINSEGSELLTQNAVLTLYISAETKAEDGMPLDNFRLYSITDEKNLPSDDRLRKDIEELVGELLALKRADDMQPYTGPALLSAEVAGVFFHEVLGHRLEGERQKDEQEGMTFKDKVGSAILPDFLTVIDDPTLYEFNNVALTGYYMYDDEGVKAERVVLVENGILKNFLMSRTPIKGFSHSNGHGRNDTVQKPMARMGNLIIQSSKEKGQDELVDMLVSECRRQNKPYGFIIDRARSGETNTSRYGFQAFKGVPLLVYKVYTENKQRELVRGVDIVGTPLTVLSKIIATGDDYTPFNGYCGAESGFVPVSVISPSILVQEIELQRSSGQKSRPPILPPPTAD